jgi:phosphatidylglycerophosphate synthase
VILRLLFPIWPAIVLGTAFFLGLAWFALRVRTRGFPELPDADRRETTAIATPFLTRYVLWFLTPFERCLVAWRISPTAITVVAVLLCAASGVLAAHERLAAAAWLYLFAGMLDILDGRVARRSGCTSQAGALIDSVADRWGEFFVLSGAAYYLRDSVALLGAALFAIAGSQMVSYVRARGEALGLALAGGTMQRAERIVLVGACLMAGAIGKVTRAFDPRLIVAIALLVVGLASTWTSLYRLRQGVQALGGDKPRRRLPLSPSHRPASDNAQESR